MACTVYVPQAVCGCKGRMNYELCHFLHSLLHYLFADENPVEKVRSRIHQLKDAFQSLKDATREELVKAGIGVTTLVDKITSLPAPCRDQHEEFIAKYTMKFSRCQNITQVFFHLNRHWEYLNCDILGHLITEFSRSFSLSRKLVCQLAAYKKNLRHFMKHTTIVLFREAEGEQRYEEPPENFKKLVTCHAWQKPNTLKKIDDFRRRFAYKYNLRSCVIFLLSMEDGSVIITMQVPMSVELMIKSTDIEFFKDNAIVYMKLSDITVYQNVSTS